MQHLMLQRRLPLFLAVAMLLTVLSGFTSSRLVAGFLACSVGTMAVARYL